MIKFILFFLIVLLYVYLLRLPKQKKYYLIIFATILCVIMSFLVFFSESSTFIAQKLGVGRGADLLFYIFNMFVIFILLHLYLNQIKIEHHIDEIVQFLALKSKKDREE